jgi:hypothetical protein
VTEYLWGLATLPLAALVFFLGHDGYLWLTSTSWSDCAWCDYRAVGPLHHARGLLHQRRAHGLPVFLRTRLRRRIYGALSTDYLLRHVDWMTSDDAQLYQRQFDREQARGVSSDAAGGAS